MYYKLKDYLDLSIEERVSYLRENGYCYNVEQTRYLPEQLLADFSAQDGNGQIPLLSPMQFTATAGGKKIMISYSLYLTEKLRQQFAKPKYVADLSHITFVHNGEYTNFYDCFIQNMLDANHVFRSVFGDTVKFRIYLSFELGFLSGMFTHHKMEVYVMHEFKAKSNHDRADYWRFLAFGDKSNADYSFSVDADEKNPDGIAQFIQEAILEKAELFSSASANAVNNSIESDCRSSITYLRGGLVGVDNRASFFSKYKVAELLRAYYSLSTAGQSFGGIDLYPSFAREVSSAGINMDAWSLMGRHLNEHFGDQCFLNSVLLFGMLKEGNYFLLRYNNAQPKEMLSYHMHYDFNFITYLQQYVNANVMFN